MAGENPCAFGHQGRILGRPFHHTPGLRALKDARGIFCGYVCDRCEEWKKAQYRPEIFTDPNYDADDLGDDEEL